jgi:membrane fusion protein (multidrug efflux system)
MAAWLAAGCHKPDAAPASDQAPVPRVKVQTAPISERAVPNLIPLTGTLLADLRTELTANSAGRVTKTFVERGQKVQRGAVLVQLDVRSAAANAAEARASVASANVQLDAARAECARYDALVARGAITPQEHDRQTANCKAQLAAVAVTKARATTASLVVGDGTIRAPFAGVVTERWVSVGDYVQAPSKVVTLVVSNPLRLKLTVPERRAAEVKEGALVTFSTAGGADRTFSGTVKYMSGEVRTTTRDVVVEAIVANDDGALLPGMFVDVSLYAGERQRPVVPQSALFATGQEKSLYVVKEGHLELRIVNVGVEVEGGVALDEGVKAGEIAVLDPSASLSDGAEVE